MLIYDRSLFVFLSVKGMAEKVTLKEPEKQKQKMTIERLLSGSRLFPSWETECRASKLSPNLGMQHDRRAGLGGAGSERDGGRRQVYIKKNALISLFAGGRVSLMTGSWVVLL